MFLSFCFVVFVVIDLYCLFSVCLSVVFITLLSFFATLFFHHLFSFPSLIYLFLLFLSCNFLLHTISILVFTSFPHH